MDRAPGRRRGRRHGRASRASCATRSAAAPTGSRSTPTIAGGLTGRAARRSRVEELHAHRRDRARAAGGRWWRTRARRKACAARSLAGVETIEHGDGGDARGVPAHGGARRRALPDGRGGRRDSRYRGLEARRGPGHAGHHAEEGELQGRPGRRRDDLQRQRRRRVHARRQRARARAARRLRHEAGGGAARGDVDRRARCFTWRTASAP